MSNTFESIVDQIRFLRWNLIPAYCENLDEDEKSYDEYEQHYEGSLERCIQDARRYLEAVEALASLSDGEALKIIFSARSRFCQSFPFCSDELIDARADELQPYLDIMAVAYRRDSSVGELQKSIAQYIKLLEDLRKG